MLSCLLYTNVNHVFVICIHTEEQSARAVSAGISRNDSRTHNMVTKMEVSIIVFYVDV
jgi:hypothetical protein